MTHLVKAQHKNKYLGYSISHGMYLTYEVKEAQKFDNAGEAAGAIDCFQDSFDETLIVEAVAA